MKEIKALEDIYLKEFDVYVKPYLTYAQIQNIINSTVHMNSWAERQQNIDMLVLYYTTDIDKSQLQELDHVVLLQSGLIDAVRNNVKNYNIIEEAIDYTTSIQRSLTTMVKELSKKLETLEKGNKNGGSNKK